MAAPFEQREGSGRVGVAMDDETLVKRPGATPPDPATSDAELSRIAREAVRQPPDPRMDRQLAKMGLTDDPMASTQTASHPSLQPLTDSD